MKEGILGPILKAKEQFEILIKNYPKTEFAIDASFKLGLITDRLAGKEMYIEGIIKNLKNGLLQLIDLRMF